MFPKPDRSDQTFKAYKTTENPSLDIGWNEGWLSDLRPYRVECWAEDGVTSNTYFMSTIGMEAMTDEQFASFLVNEGLLEFNSNKRYVDAAAWTDASGNDMWSVNVVVGDDSETYVRDLIPLRRYAFNADRTASIAGIQNPEGAARQKAWQDATRKQMETGVAWRQAAEQHPAGPPDSNANQFPLGL